MREKKYGAKAVTGKEEGAEEDGATQEGATQEGAKESDKEEGDKEGWGGKIKEKGFGGKKACHKKYLNLL